MLIEFSVLGLARTTERVSFTPLANPQARLFVQVELPQRGLFAETCQPNQPELSAC
jgi:hypothetical protein